ncbi:septum formation family protein [Actinocrispum wychmicini]|uniref:Putative regulator of septum formation n=1 Tax=Actinocrispum wychmicini TaxID=1213861 RepID=A0A4R2J673_9PSEU|nr:septum formation family protein [Actinocrispum wychmicini]TCO50655.1 putative regulator of septum formation [Actinocrispum wychmicini]
MTDPTTAGLREIAGPQLYRRNAFRITGLDTDADRRAVRHRQQKVVLALEAGVDIDLDVPVELDEMRAAFERILGDPRRRLVDEMFWLWKTANASCGCPKTLHLAHDKAVRAHSAALDREVAGLTLQDQDEVEKLWAEASSMWSRVLRHDSFWHHVSHRIAVLDDKQLDESVIGVLREELPMTLVKPMIRLVAGSPTERTWLAGSVRGWPVPSGAVDDLWEEAAEPLYAELRAELTEAAEQLTAGEPVQAGTAGMAIVPRLDRLETLVPAARHRRTVSVRNDISLLLNNCATVYMEQVGPVADEQARLWLRTAGELSADPQGKAMIEHNLTTLDDMMTVFRTIRERVDELVGMGRNDLAWRMLRDARRRLGAAPGVDEIDKMLADLGDRRAKARLAAPTRPTRVTFQRPSRMSAVTRIAAALLFWGLVGLSVFLIFFNGSGDSDAGGTVVSTTPPTPSGADTGGTPVNVPDPVDPVPVRVYSERIADNSAVGTCIATKDAWAGDKTKVASVPCRQSHWGEILGYVSLGPAPSPYPGTDQTEALAHYQCASARTQQGLTQSDYIVDFAYPGPQDWNAGGKAYENYATCVIHRKDNLVMPFRQVTDTSRTDRNFAVTMDMYAGAIYADPPIGVCPQDKQSYDKDRHAVAIVDCTRPHWGQILGYPVLYQADKDPWPGDTAVYAAASDACLKIQRDHGLNVDSWHSNVTWPGQDAWTNAASDKRIYAVCTVSLTDESPLFAPVN